MKFIFNSRLFQQIRKYEWIINYIHTFLHVARFASSCAMSHTERSWDEQKKLILVELLVTYIYTYMYVCMNCVTCSWRTRRRRLRVSWFIWFHLTLPCLNKRAPFCKDCEKSLLVQKGRRNGWMIFYVEFKLSRHILKELTMTDVLDAW